MFGIFKPKKPFVHKWWYVVLLDFEASTEEFYSAIEQDLIAREVHGMELSRVEYAEGGLLSAQREYLRMMRERLLFDVCSAPFGTSWLFSCRFSEFPVTIRVWEVFALLIALAGFWFSYVSLFGFFTGNIVFGATLLGVILAMVCAVPFGFHDLDSALMQLPVVGPFYEVFFRKDTYYRQDTRAAYTTIVNSIVRARVQEIAKARGVEEVQFFEQPPEISPSFMETIAAIFGKKTDGH